MQPNLSNRLLCQPRQLASSLFRLLFSLALLLVVVPAANAQIDFNSPFSLPGGEEGGAPFGQIPFGQQPTNAQAAAKPVVIASVFTAATSEQPALLRVTATIAPSYHIYGTTQPAGGPGATKISLDDSINYKLSGVVTSQPAPEIKYDSEVWDLDVHKHKGSVTWFLPLEIAPNVDASSLKVTGKVSLQACDAGSCLPLKLPFEATLVDGSQLAAPPVVIAPTSDSQGVGSEGGGSQGAESQPINAQALLLNLGFAFLGGFILNFMPCVLPVIGLKVLSFAEQGGESRFRVLGLNLAYSAGLISVFMVLAGLAAFAGFGWGEQFTSTGFQLAMVFLVFAMGLSFLGVWEIPIPGFAGAGKANDLQAKEGYAGAFFKGIFTTILATPCSGPFLGSALGFTLTLPPALVFLFFFAVGLGMAAPYLLIGMYPALVKWIPKPGMWMETFKQLMGFGLLAATVFLMWAVKESLYLPVLSTLVAIGFGCWWIGSTSITASSLQRKVSWVVGLGFPIIVGWAALSYDGTKYELDWQPYSQASLMAANETGKISIVEFSADWCLTCKLNLKSAINTEAVKEVVESNGIVPLLADWTDGSEAIEKKLNELGSNSIPLLAIYPANQPNSPIILRDVITKTQLLNALQQAGATIEETPTFIEPTIEIGEVSSVPALR